MHCVKETREESSHFHVATSRMEKVISNIEVNVCEKMVPFVCSEQPSWMEHYVQCEPLPRTNKLIRMLLKVYIIDMCPP